MALDEIRSERIKKLNDLRQSGIEPYPSEASKDRLPIGDVLNDAFKKTKIGFKLVSAKLVKKYVITGRLMAKREHGGSCFCDLKDASSKIQIFFKKDVVGDDQFDIFMRNIDIGDFLEISGNPFFTKRGEPTIEVLSWRMLSKSLRPLPEKWHGLQDIEERFRKRYLDLLSNPEVAEKFRKRTEIIKETRRFFESENFEEVDTPALQSVAGGALARPFVTHHNALDMDLYLRIAPELYLKRLLIGGYEKVFEIARNFRNEGIDATHNPEFTMLEAYSAWWDEKDMMNFVEKFFTCLVKKIFGKRVFEHDGNKIECKTPFPRITFAEVLKKFALVDNYDTIAFDDIRMMAQRLGITVYDGESKGRIADDIFKKQCRPKLKNPTFVINHPLDISPLAKSQDPQAPALAEKGRTLTVRRFQLIVGGLEIVNGFSELNDPLDQRARFEEQEKMRGVGEEEAHRIDEDFIAALEYGMLPAAGVGIGIDRLIMLLTNTHNIKEVILFPTMKPAKKHE